MKVALLVSGASGMVLPQRVLRALASGSQVSEVHLVVSAGASQVLRHELGADRAGADDLVASSSLSGSASAKVHTHRDSAIDAAIASGSYRLQGTVVLPCSAGTLGALATGSARTLVHRAGAVALKERWPLILGFRETPLSIVHLENLRRLAYAGAHIVPPIPAFYVGRTESDGGGVESLERFIDHYAMRVLDLLGVRADRDEGLRWRSGDV